MELLQPKIVTDGGPWANHNMPCAVCGKAHAVLDLSTAIFHPCRFCAKEWVLKKKNFLTKILERKR